jgi:hypothetical protein
MNVACGQTFISGLLHLGLILALEPRRRIMGQGGRGPDPHQPVAIPRGNRQGLKAFLARPERQGLRHGLIAGRIKAYPTSGKSLLSQLSNLHDFIYLTLKLN